MAPGFALAAYRKSRLAVRSALRSMVKEVTCQVRGVEIRVGVSSETEQERAEAYATAEPETLDWLDANLRDGDVFFDVGANIGMYALYAAAVRPNCRVYAFEPAASNYSRLCANIVSNAFTNIIPCQMPLAEKEAFALFYLGAMENGSALHALGRPSLFRPSAEPALKQGVFSATLDGLVFRHGVPQPALMKIDVDGAEADVLSGGRDVLRSHALRTVLVEITSEAADDGLPAAANGLTSAGLRLATRGSQEWTISNLSCRNYVFTRFPDAPA